MWMTRGTMIDRLTYGAAAALILGTSHATAQDLNLQVPVIVTTGEATVGRASDQAFITVAVEARAKSPREAQRQAAAAIK